MLLSLTCVSAVEDNQTAGDVELQSDEIEEDALEASYDTSFSDLFNQFARSNYTLEKDFTFDSNRDTSFIDDPIRITKSNIVIDGKGHSIDALGNCRVFDVIGTNVILKNITFLNAKSNEEGGAVNFVNSGSVINCNFIGNNASSGGALYFYTQSSVINCTFEANTAGNGGAIYNRYNGVSVSNCEFRDNHARNGGAIYCDGGDIDYSSFADNSADYLGGAFYVDVRAQLSVQNSVFERNRGKGAGYNVYLSEGARLITNNVTPSNLIPESFTSLKAKIDGCLGDYLVLEYDYTYRSEIDSALGNTGIEINQDNLIIDGREHTIDGDGQTRLFNIKSNNVTLMNINFINGYSSDSGGGAVRIEHAATIDRCTFDNNYGNPGGAISQLDLSGSTIKVTNSIFTNNRGAGGIAILFTGGLIDKCTFINNSGGGSGGAIQSRGTATISNSFFINNSARSWGGAIDAEQSCIITNNLFRGNSASGGGAIILYRGGTISDSTFESNVAYGSSDGGGAITLSSGGSVSRSTFINNNATNIGGAIEGWGTITQCSFTGNHAGNNGGAIFSKGATVKYSNFTSNTANNGGGGIYSEGGDFNHLNFVENSAKNGGGLYSTKGEIHNLTFSSNVAGSNGGGLYLTSGRKVIGCIFSYNTAGDKGGAISFNGQSTIDNVNFTGNSAKNGGAVYSSNVLTINNTNFKEDNACSGGAIQITKDLDLHNTNFKDNFATDGTNYINLIGDAKITLDNVAPEHVNPYKVSAITITYATNGTAYSDEAYITLKVTSENKPITEGFAAITLNNENYTASIINGTGTINISTVDVGRYACNITYFSYNYTVEKAFIDFYIVKKEVSFTVNIANVTVGEKLKFTVNMDSANINSGTVSAVINNREYVEYVVNGTATFEISGLNADNYSALISYNGGFNYYNPSQYIYFSVLKRNVSLEAYAENITYGDVLKITAKITNDSTVINEGFVQITIGNDTYVAYVTNGNATLEIPNLDVGKYSCNLSYIGGQNNTGQSKQVNFTVFKRIYSIGIEADNITYGDTAEITVNIVGTAGNIAEGIVFLGISDNVYEKVLENGRTTFEIPMLNAGTYTGEIVFYSQKNSIFQKQTFSYGVSPKTIILNSSYIPNQIYYGDTVKLIVNVTCDDEIIDNGTVTVNLNNERFNAPVENGSATFEISNLLVETYDGTIEYDGGNNYQKVARPINFEVLEKIVNLSVNFTNAVYGDVLRVCVNVTSNRGPVNEGKVTANILGENHSAKVENGIAIIEVSNLNVGTYDCRVAFDGGYGYNSTPKQVQFDILRNMVDLTVNISDNVYGEVLRVCINVISATGSVNEGNVTMLFNNGYQVAKVEKGFAIIEIPNLDAGTYNATITFDGGDNYNRPTASIDLNVLKRNVEVLASNKAYVINYGGEYSVTVQGVAGEKVTFTFNGKNMGSVILDSNGIAAIYLTVEILKAAGAGTRNLVIELDGANYQAPAKTVKITVVKEKTKIAAKKKTFKKAKKVKKYSITLKDSKNKAISQVKVTLKIKGKTFKAKTNAKGKAIFKIKKLTKKGTFKAKVSFKGNSYYDKVTKTVKIKVRG